MHTTTPLPLDPSGPDSADPARHTGWTIPAMWKSCGTSSGQNSPGPASVPVSGPAPVAETVPPSMDEAGEDVSLMLAGRNGVS
jgi:hypothetical protein